MAGKGETVLERWFEEVWNQRRLDTIHELLTSESVCIVDDGPIKGPEEFRQRVFDPFLAAFPDLKVEVKGVISDGDQVAVRWEATGTHTGEMPGLKASQKPVEFRSITWSRVVDGKLAEGWQSSNIPEVFRSLNQE
ncbi:ester cyclase [Singulisphaera sp. PoT]|uniref:ester cyclase n=1 Tax=Singulisphaera sp. PoT TaxID=3411797 RepID=UPI003BF602E0